ncbi:Uncharacterised protein [Acinetobacter baumannii]|nr:Uncharacterised protein [Acinetobacter baumannii]
MPPIISTGTLPAWLARSSSTAWAARDRLATQRMLSCRSPSAYSRR